MQSSYFPYVLHTYFLLYRLKVSSSLLLFYESIIWFPSGKTRKAKETTVHLVLLFLNEIKRSCCTMKSTRYEGKCPFLPCPWQILKLRKLLYY